VATAQGSSAVRPVGCSISVDAGGAAASVYFNTNATSAASCGAGVDTVEGVQPSLVTLGLALSASDGATSHGRVCH
jgi:hypothetical protein